MVGVKDSLIRIDPSKDQEWTPKMLGGVQGCNQTKAFIGIQITCKWGKFRLIWTKSQLKPLPQRLGDSSADLD